MTKTIGRVAAAIVLLLVQAAFASAAEIKVFSTIGVKSVLEEMIPKFEKETGNKLNITWSTAALLTKRVQAGEMADAFILVAGNIDVLQKAGKVAPGSEVRLPTSIIAIAIKKGAPKPDISTPEALKKSLLAARAISYSNPAAGGASGVYFSKQLVKMGIADAMKAKTKFPPAGGFAGNLLKSGEVDIAIQTSPELASVEGVEVLGPLPGDMAFTAAFAAAVGSGATQPAGAKALLKFLTSPEAQAVFKAKGFNPV
jgi:molybdate transport system substrate-binding protein